MPSRLNTAFCKVIKERVAVYFLMQKGEFPTSLMGFELALCTHHRKKNTLQDKVMLAKCW